MKSGFPTVALQDDETSTSFLSRVAARNGTTAAGFCRDWSIAFQPIVDGCSDALTKLATIARCDPAKLIGQALKKLSPTEWVWRDQHLVKSSLRRTRMLACPACLADDVAGRGRLARAFPYGRAIWQIEAIRTCPRHGIALMDLPGSGEAGLYDFAASARTALPMLTDLTEAAIRRPASQLETYIVNRAGDGPSGIWLDTLDLHASAALVEMTGALKMGGLEVAIADFDEAAWYAAGAAGFDIVQQGPESIRSFWCDLQRSSIRQSGMQGGPQAQLGQAYRWLAYRAGHRSYDPIRALMRDHIIETLPVGPGDEIFGAPVTERKIHSIRSASLEYKAHPKRLRKILRAEGLINADQDDLLDDAVLFNAAQADAVIIKAQSALSLNDVEKHLNIHRVQARILLDEGFIEPFVRLDGGGRRNTTEHNFARADVDAFFKALTATAVSVDHAPEGAFGIPAAAKRACCGTGEILRLILASRLKWVGRLTAIDGFSGLLVDLDDVKGQVHGSRREGLTAREIEGELVTSTKVVRALIANGRLLTTTIINPINRCPTDVVAIAEIVRFRKEYVSLFNLAVERGQHFRALQKELEANGIRPVLDRASYGAAFYLRRDLA